MHAPRHGGASERRVLLCVAKSGGATIWHETKLSDAGAAVQHPSAYSGADLNRPLAAHYGSNIEALSKDLRIGFRIRLRRQYCKYYRLFFQADSVNRVHATHEQRPLQSSAAVERNVDRTSAMPDEMQFSAKEVLFVETRSAPATACTRDLTFHHFNITSPCSSNVISGSAIKLRNKCFSASSIY